MRGRRGCRWMRMDLPQEACTEFVDAGRERRQIMVSRREASVHEGQSSMRERAARRRGNVVGVGRPERRVQR